MGKLKQSLLLIEETHNIPLDVAPYDNQQDNISALNQALRNTLKNQENKGYEGKTSQSRRND